MKIILQILIILTLFATCSDPKIDMIYRTQMREFVQSLSKWSKSQKPDFIIIPQNGHDLFSTTEEPDAAIAIDYLSAVNGAGQEDLFYGYEDDNIATPTEDNSWIRGFLDIGKKNGVTILVTDYCNDSVKMADSYKKNSEKGYISFAANHRGLDNVPNFPINNSNPDTIKSLADVKNFLYLIDPEQFASKSAFIETIDTTNYDLFIIDLFVGENISLSKEDLAKLKTKPNGAPRLVVSYMSIGEAEDYRYYWQSDWKLGYPLWLREKNPDWEGNFKVEYWQKDWQDIIFGNSTSYLQKIINAGFDGAYLDIIEAFEYFE